MKAEERDAIILVRCSQTKPYKEPANADVRGTPAFLLEATKVQDAREALRKFPSCYKRPVGPTAHTYAQSWAAKLVFNAH